MTLTQKESLHIYDNGGETIDRYTVLFTQFSRHDARYGTLYECIGMGSDVTSPQGFYQHSDAVDGKHLGKRILFEQLPSAHQKRIAEEFEAV